MSTIETFRKIEGLTIYNLQRRIEKIEEGLSIGQHGKPSLPPVILFLHSEHEPATDPDTLGPVETWLTFQQQLQAGQKANAEHLRENPFALPEIMVIVLDADEEVRARGQLKATM